MLLLLRQEVSLSVVPVGPDDVGARRWRRHAGGIVVDGLPGIGGGEAVVALGDVRVRPHLCGGVVQNLIWKTKQKRKLIIHVPPVVFISEKVPKSRDLTQSQKKPRLSVMSPD